MYAAASARAAADEDLDEQATVIDLAETDKTVSAPNQVAKTQAKLMYKGSDRPATMKSFALCTRLDA